MCFLYPDEDKENRYMWCCGIVTRVNRRDDKMKKGNTIWEESFIACGKSYLTEKILKKKIVESGDAKNMRGGRMYNDT